MKRFFYDMQGYFKATYSGRYLAFILAELFRRDPDAFERVLNKAGISYTRKRGDNAIANHWPLPLRAQRRFADIAVINAVGEPLVLIEIKDADIKSENNAAQLDDYLTFIDEKKNQNVKFLFLSRTIPREEDERKLQAAKSKTRVRVMFFRELHEPLKGSKVFGQMLRDYLEDINVAYHAQKPDQNIISYVTNVMLGIAGRKATEKSVPKFFEIVFGNLSSIGLWVQNANPKLFKQVFKRRLYVEPYYDVKRLKGVLTAKNQRAAVSLLESQSLYEYCRGGNVYLYTCGNLRDKNTQVYLEFGYWLEAERSSMKSVSYKHTSGIYGKVQWKPWKDTKEDTVEGWSDPMSSFPDEKTFQKELRGFLSRTKTGVLARKSCPNDVKRLLQKFRIP